MAAESLRGESRQEHVGWLLNLDVLLVWLLVEVPAEVAHLLQHLDAVHLGHLEI